MGLRWFETDVSGLPTGPCLRVKMSKEEAHLRRNLVISRIYVCVYMHSHTSAKFRLCSYKFFVVVLSLSTFRCCVTAGMALLS
jgi:hypothetical protein